MADLESVLATVRDRIAKYQGQGIGEQDTKAALIVPILRALGWDTEDLEAVKLEYKRKPADYALVLLRQPRLFIEAKALGAHLDDPRWANQFLGYATAAGVEWWRSPTATNTGSTTATRRCRSSRNCSARSGSRTRLRDRRRR